MYSSYGNRAAIGSGRRGHGGGNYRPPSRKREKSNQQPPPIKECYCVAEWQVDEYSQPAESVRQHDLFGGRESMESYKSTLRQKFAIHLVVPGRRQAGRHVCRMVSPTCFTSCPLVIAKSKCSHDNNTTGYSTPSSTHSWAHHLQKSQGTSDCQ